MILSTRWNSIRFLWVQCVFFCTISSWMIVTFTFPAKLGREISNWSMYCVLWKMPKVFTNKWTFTFSSLHHLRHERFYDLRLCIIIEMLSNDPVAAIIMYILQFDSNAFSCGSFLSSRAMVGCSCLHNTRNMQYGWWLHILTVGFGKYFRIKRNQRKSNWKRQGLSNEI